MLSTATVTAPDALAELDGHIGHAEVLGADVGLDGGGGLGVQVLGGAA